MSEPLPDTRRACVPITLHIGPIDCLEGECDELYGEDGEPTSVEQCSHVSLGEYCELHSTLNDEGSEWEYYDPAEPWPCRHAAAVPVPAPPDGALCPRCDGSGIDPEHSDEGCSTPGEEEPPALEPCIACQYRAVNASKEQ
jgi:hypothetical protein